MVECDHHPTYKDVSSTGSFDSIQEKIIQDELIWGISYRHMKQKEKEVPIPTKHSPIDIPFKICREKQRQRKQKRKAKKKEQKEEKPQTPKKKQQPPEKLSLLERSVLTQNQYMNYLAIPNSRPSSAEPAQKKTRCRCYIEPCPPRLVQLAVPGKRRVFANWKEYYNTLPTPMVMRFEKILHTDKNLEPREARYYYKKLDKQRIKRLRKKRRLRKKKKADKERGDQAWLDEQIQLTTKVIMDYFMEEPLFTLNYRQLMLSDGILERLDEANILKKPCRSSRNQFKKSIIEFSDKLAVWMDILTRFVDIQAIDGDDDIPPLTISSVGEEEEGSTYYSELEEGLWREFGEGEGELGEGFGFGLLGLGLFGEGEGGSGFFDMDLDLLEKLIRILSNCSDEYLDSEVNGDRIPGVRYIDILNRVKELRDGILKKGPQKPFLEMVMLEWAIKNEPDEIDDKMKNKIHETAALLGDFLFGAGGLRGLGAMFGADMYGEEGEGGDLEDEFMKGRAGMGLGAGVGGAGWGEDEIDEDELRRRMEEEERRRRELEEEERRRREMERLARLEAEGGDASGLGGLSGRDDGEGLDGAGLGLGLGGLGGLGEEGFGEEGEVAVLFGPGLEGRIIKGHKPPVILEHRPDMVCCLSLKIWAVWLLEITHNAHNWTKWVHCIILQIREFASIIRGDVKLPDGTTKKLYKAEWRQFAEETAKKHDAWQEYSKHVKELSNSIIENYHGKKVLNCCPKCLEDHLITNVVKAHETLAALTEAMNQAEYWQKCLDEIVQKTCRLADLEQIEKEAVSSEEEEEEEEEEEDEAGRRARGLEGVASIYEIEELDPAQGGGGVCTPRPGGPGPSGPWQGYPGGRGGPPGPWQGGPSGRGGPPGPWQGPGPSQGRGGRGGGGCNPRRF